MSDDQAPSANRVFNLKATLAVLFILVFLGIVAWSVVNGKLDPMSFLTGLAPLVGFILKDLYGGQS